jgi:hypothetical protein
VSRLLCLGTQETSFREFCAQPENRALVERTQKAEVTKVHKAEQQARALKFRDVVLSSSPEAQRAVAPFLKVPVLRQIVQTIANDQRGNFSQWATNPTIIEYLSLAKKALDDGLMTEAEAEHLILAQIKVRHAGPGEVKGGGPINGRAVLTPMPGCGARHAGPAA